ncbi:unnamed protein product [Vicia faba]|uniref:Uncharacterized protein n=1 Tax=Vicia faba TaxID=3906 RepID=A0AAV1BAE8_VICFA|nr:unnamed protein product [Vicia faba]
MENQDADKDVPGILSDMLTESQIYKENDDVTSENNTMSDDDHVQENIEVDIVVAHGGVVNNHDEKIKPASKGKKDHAVKDVVINDENISMGCDINSKGIYAGSSSSQMLWCNQMLKDFTKDGNEDVNSNVLDNMYGMLLIEFPIQRKDDQVSLFNSKVNRKLVQTNSETSNEEDVLDIMHTVRIKVGGKRIYVYV